MTEELGSEKVAIAWMKRSAGAIEQMSRDTADDIIERVGAPAHPRLHRMLQKAYKEGFQDGLSGHDEIKSVLTEETNDDNGAFASSLSDFSSEQVAQSWRGNCQEMESMDVRCNEEADKILDALDLPNTRSGWRRILANIFVRGASYGVREFDAIRGRIEENHREFERVVGSENEAAGADES